MSKKNKTIIHVNQHSIRRNQKTGEREPVLSVKNRKNNQYGHEAVIYDLDGKEVARVVYSPDCPLSCGARVWVEVGSDNGRVEVIKTIQTKCDAVK